MPIVNLKRDLLFKALERNFTLQEFEDLCFDFGIELDDVTSEAEIISKMKGIEASKGYSEEVIYKIDIPANRYDLLCLEGLARGLRVFLEKEDPPSYLVSLPSSPTTLRVEAAVESVRPFVVSAIIRDVEFDVDSFQSFIDVQDKLHQNICRGRTLVAIGTHDLDSVTPPFTYAARKPTDICFQPLKESREFNAEQLFAYYKQKPQCELKKFLPIIESSPVYPVILDANGKVLSLPPIINSELSKVSVQTRNLFIECTANDLTKAKIVINTMCCMFSQYSRTPFTVEAVDVQYEGNTAISGPSPNLDEISFSASVDRINRGIGIDIDADQMGTLLHRMQLRATSSADKKTLSVCVPPTRSDVLHECDILEDVAIAYGFNRIQKTIPRCYTISRQQPLNVLSDLLRHGLAEAGYNEVLTWALVSHDENFENMQQQDDGRTAVTVGNPKTLEFEMVRTTLLPGLLKTLGHNKAHIQLPIQLFELSDVALLDSASDVGARNERHLALIYCGRTSGFELIHGALDRVMQLNNVVFRDEVANEGSGRPSVGSYCIEASNNNSFLPKLRADVFFQKRGESEWVRIGSFGVLHPNVFAAFGIDSPCSALEIDISVFI